jgi:hypothetical protein
MGIKKQIYAKSLCLRGVAAAVLLVRLCIDLDAAAENSSACAVPLSPLVFVLT